MSVTSSTRPGDHADDHLSGSGKPKYITIGYSFLDQRLCQDALTKLLQTRPTFIKNIITTLRGEDPFDLIMEQAQARGV